jgi:UDP-2-acetamido-2,6-beta-L-arabino-hexul-4-ose reductase
LAQKVVDALESSKSKAHLIFSSSTQEERDNEYGKSKKECRKLLYNWSHKSGGKFTGLIIPNVFGPFGHPKYNSVIATFCYQIAREETPVIDIDGELNLIYVGDLVHQIIQRIRTNDNTNESFINHTAKAKVSEILSLFKFSL